MPSLYIHIPFCVRKCVYCDFYLEPLGTGPIPQRMAELEKNDQSNFIDALEIEFHSLPEGFSPETIYIGGGTPTELRMKDFKRLFEIINRYTNVKGVKEWTCEANPGTMSREKAEVMHAAGVDRVSLGVQSFQPAALEYLSRIHSDVEAVDSYEMLRSVGFMNVSLDLIFGTPGTSVQDVIDDRERILTLQPEHVSWYLLDYVEGTALTKLRNDGRIKELEEDILCLQYDEIRTGMKSGGFDQYEIFNYAHAGASSLHNARYWEAGEYYGLGPSAHSHIDGTRWYNLKHTGNYIRLLGSGQQIRRGIETLDAEAKARELLMTTLRRCQGVSLEWFRTFTGYDLLTLGGDALRAQLEYGSLHLNGDQLVLDPDSYLIANSILAEFV